jgi:hypothetical protein
MSTCRGGAVLSPAADTELIINAQVVHAEMTSWVLPKGLDDGLPVPVGDFSLNKSAPGNRNFVKKEIVLFF